MCLNNHLNKIEAFFFFRLLDRRQNQQEPGCCPRGVHMQVATAESLMVVHSVSFLILGNYPVRRACSIPICELYVLTLEVSDFQR